MSGTTPEASERAIERGIITIVGNTVDEYGRQFITCPPERLLTAENNTTAKYALQCLGPQRSETIEQVSRDFPQPGQAFIDARPAESNTQFRGHGRTYNSIGDADSGQRHK